MMILRKIEDEVGGGREDEEREEKEVGRKFEYAEVNAR